MKFKNRLGASESNHMRALSPKNEPIRPRGLGCRWGATVFGGFSPYISIVSIESRAGSSDDSRLREDKAMRFSGQMASFGQPTGLLWATNWAP